MTITIDAVYDGKVFRPSKPVKIEPNTKVRILVEYSENAPVSFLDVAQSLDLAGPADWSQKIDDYLYGERVNGS
jgi:predicted DNA-binding antitoxin AbrB/MazE fold protein